MGWLSHFWFVYVWPSCKGNGPEAVIQTVVYGAIALVFVPPLRRWFGRHMEALKSHITAEHAAVHAKLDHVIKHSPDIPDFKETK